MTDAPDAQSAQPPKFCYLFSCSALLLSLVAEGAGSLTRPKVVNLLNVMRLRGDTLYLWGSTPHQALLSLSVNPYICQLTAAAGLKGFDEENRLTSEFVLKLLPFLSLQTGQELLSVYDTPATEGGLGRVLPTTSFEYRMPMLALSSILPRAKARRGYFVLGEHPSAEDALVRLSKDLNVAFFDAESSVAFKANLEMLFVNKDDSGNPLYGDATTTLRSGTLQGPTFDGYVQVVEPDAHEWLYADTVPVSWGGLHPDETHPLLETVAVLKSPPLCKGAIS